MQWIEWAPPQRITSNEIIVSRTNNSFIDSNEFRNEANFPYQEGLLMLPRSN